MTKHELRKKYLAKRKALSTDEVLLLSKQIFQNFIQYFEVLAGQKIHIFMSIAKLNEVETDLFITHFLRNNLEVYLPKINGDNIITVRYNDNTEMRLNSWGISEPVENADAGVKDFDYVITPLLYCDSDGNRVGFGKGYYDKFFSQINPHCKKVGVGFFAPIEPVDDVSITDIPLDYLVTPVEALSFKGRV